MTGEDLIALLKKKPIVSLSVGVCVVCALIWYFRADAMSDAASEYNSKSTEDQAMAADLRNGSGLPHQVELMQLAEKQLNARLIHASRLASNLQYFYRLESETGVKLIDARQQALNPTKPGSNPPFIRVPFALVVSGEYKQVMNFLYRLEAGRHFCRFNSVNLTKSTSASTADAMALTLGIELLGTP